MALSKKELRSATFTKWSPVFLTNQRGKDIEASRPRVFKIAMYLHFPRKKTFK